MLCPDIEFHRKHNRMHLIRKCDKGRNCYYAHSKEEQLYHPMVYKARMCKSHESCYRRFCPFAHNLDEVRNALSLDSYLKLVQDYWKNKQLNSNQEEKSISGNTQLTAALEAVHKQNQQIQQILNKRNNKSYFFSHKANQGSEAVFKTPQSTRSVKTNHNDNETPYTDKTYSTEESALVEQKDKPTNDTFEKNNDSYNLLCSNLLNNVSIKNEVPHNKYYLDTSYFSETQSKNTPYNKSFSKNDFSNYKSEGVELINNNSDYLLNKKFVYNMKHDGHDFKDFWVDIDKLISGEDDLTIELTRAKTILLNLQ